MTPFETFIQEKEKEFKDKSALFIKGKLNAVALDDFLTTTLTEAKEVIKKELEGKLSKKEICHCIRIQCTTHGSNKYLSEVKEIIKSL